MNCHTPKSKRKEYRSPIRKKTEVIFVYADPINKRFLESNLKIITSSRWVNNLITLIREGHPEFAHLIEAVELTPLSRKKKNILRQNEDSR